MALVQVSKQPKCPKVLSESAKSHLGCSSRESQKSLSHRPSPVSHRGKLPEKGFRTMQKLFWETHPGGPKTPFAPSLSTFGHFGCFDSCIRAAESQLMVSPRGFLFLCFWDGCAFKVAIPAAIYRSAFRARASKCPPECFLGNFGHLPRSAPKSAF